MTNEADRAIRCADEALASPNLEHGSLAATISSSTTKGSELVIVNGPEVTVQEIPAVDVEESLHHDKGLSSLSDRLNAAFAQDGHLICLPQGTMAISLSGHLLDAELPMAVMSRGYSKARGQPVVMRWRSPAALSGQPAKRKPQPPEKSRAKDPFNPKSTGGFSKPLGRKPKLRDK
ncbi:uncharacterized protein MYCGRDRAFT_97853 [Zymoseptoria tritici IPO323]|uniref:Uncharacterized protein n=1 Tax=Zymoseptoria tritici (strain CBS 115943 / IPO323) TaxID=336722 RepID=F9XRK7_ZYMTI|nr:uncharacterized protein MYCGRDRAFT_97853 [Zymoseptoria tritici IPO323]EGP82112.1 hypothetical protein MYCGRDRAFT_97853 [Zymoseptoria tritici IPO323]